MFQRSDTAGLDSSGSKRVTSNALDDCEPRLQTAIAQVTAATGTEKRLVLPSEKLQWSSVRLSALCMNRFFQHFTESLT